jgi:predicted ATP-dependent serine protease
MALIVCLRCDKTYGESNPQCPHCGTHNFFADDDTLGPAVDVLCERIYHEAGMEKKAKLAELQDVKEELMPHTMPLWKSIWRKYRDEIVIGGIVATVFMIAKVINWNWSVP